jgi:hypothetical protein
MELVIHLFARGTAITGISTIISSLKAIDGFCKLEGHPFLSNPFISKEKIAMG